jgi:hypothetical protein
MSNVVDFDFQLESLQPPKENEALVGLGWVQAIDVVVSKEEKEYQRLISEKLRVVADWDFQDSRQFSIK